MRQVLLVLLAMTQASEISDRKMVVESSPKPTRAPTQFSPNTSPEYYKQDRIPFMNRTPHSGDKGTLAIKFTDASDTTLDFYVRHPKSGTWRAVGTSGSSGSVATELAANGANCSAGNYPLGVDQFGAVESCTAVSSVCAAGGGGGSVVCSGASNSSAGTKATTSGGDSNTASAGYSTVAGGQDNFADSNATHATISGGYSNYIQGNYGVIAGGNNNTSTPTGVTYGGFVGGGEANNAGASGAVIVGGKSNSATGILGSIGGGEENEIIPGPASGSHQTVSGGYSNVARRSHSTVPGGNDNTADGDYAFAAGNRSKVSAKGSFGWADSQASDLLTNTTDQFNVRAQGGFYVEASSATFTNEIGVGVIPSLGMIHVDKGTGVGQITADGSTGGCLMLRDTDDAGWTECDALDGVLTCSVDADGLCD